MLNHLIVASLLTLTISTTTTTTTAAAQPAPAPIAPDRGCLVTPDLTTPVFQIERKSDRIKDDKETTLSITSNGAWVYTETQHGKRLRTTGGCLTKPELQVLTSSLAKATWKTSVADVRCTAYATDHVAYAYKGKHVLTTRMCDGLVLDKLTEKAMADATAITNKLIPTP